VGLPVAVVLSVVMKRGQAR